MKENVKRITDTIKFIRSADVSPAAAMELRGQVADALQNWFDAHRAEADVVSVAMSQNKSKNRPNNEKDRAYRRAIILIKCVAYPNSNRPDQHAGNVNSLVSSNFKTALGDELQTSGRVLELTSATGLNGVYQQLLANPERFFTEESVKVSQAKGGGEMEYAMYYDPSRERYEFNSVAAAGKNPHKKILVYLVRAVNWHEIPTFPEIVPTVMEASGSPPLMITTQFTGCTLCYAANGGGLLAAHVSPDGLNKTPGKAKTGAGLGADLANGRFAGFPRATFRRYVRDAPKPADGYPKTDEMYVFGVHTNRRWELWSQHVFPTNKKVYRIFPDFKDCSA